MRRALLTLAAAVLLVPAAPALAGTLSFTPPAQLPHGDPTQAGFLSGGEPSLAFDPTGDGHVYVTAPQGIPSAVGGLIGSQPTGVGYWASDDHGSTWPRSGATGSGAGGGDSDVEVLRDHTVLVADLEAAAAAICTSHDFAKTFEGCDNGLATNQEGPENDREWLTAGTKPGEVYLTYHDFAGGFPIIERSTDSGQSFTPCGTIIDPAGPAAQNYTPSGGTLVSKPVLGSDGTLYVEFTEPDATASPVGAALDHLYMGVAEGGCTGTTVFKDYVIYENPGADLARIFQAQSIDGGGELYVLAGGKIVAGGNEGLWLFTSTDGGKTWSKPIGVNPPETKANVFPAIAGGPQKGEVAFAWYGTSTSGDPNGQTNQWNVFAGESFDGGRTIATTQVSPTPLHYGDVCTQGIFCGLIPGQPGNRNLADFQSIAVDPSTGCPAIAIPGDPYNRPDQPNGNNTQQSSTYFSRAADRASCFTAGNAGQPASAVVGGSTTCLDRVAPVARVFGARRVGHGRLRLDGKATDRGCGRGGKGKVTKVLVAVARRSGAKCRFVTARGGLTAARACSKPVLLRAHGTARWTLTLERRLSKGRYVVYVRGYDAAGNRSPLRSRTLKP